MSAPSTSGLSVELLLRVIDVKHGYFTLLLYMSSCVTMRWCTMSCVVLCSDATEFTLPELIIINGHEVKPSEVFRILFM